ncbi:divergent PAP2 family protein [Alkalihalobacillus sp. MEB130]|uniref:divergent PAP2 family protein n=1 Tax=Alkalihalobacillus sp. MEB130 TaxID=2976704 RepID=UPI0028E04D6C|nr:divergent PAP2 family protein [Alkalihalobacillus sp. MEB130]MDT8860632.1 divergent PAP2 family protein [Alkalihalobacillus sp. MEB130]
MNRPMMTALTTIGIAQSLKIPIHKAKTGKWDTGLLFETGGMPSSHSAGVTALATFIALERGLPSIDFALATVFGLIVMYDAQGIRRQTGELTIKVNDMDEELNRLTGLHSPQKNEDQSVKLRERLGHMPEEVLGGALLGFVTGTLGYLLTGK